MKAEQIRTKSETKATKEKFFQLACDQEFLEVLAALAKKHRASKAHIARLAVFKLAERNEADI